MRVSCSRLIWAPRSWSNRILVLGLLCVHPDFQRQGLGEQALQTIIDAADAQGLPVSLAVLKANPAKRLYDRLGFAVVSETDIEFLMTRPGRSG